MPQPVFKKVPTERELLSKKYYDLSNQISEALPQITAYNPQATNAYINLAHNTFPEEASPLTNSPKTLLVVGHGSDWPSDKGFIPDPSETNSVANLVRSKMNVSDTMNYSDMIKGKNAVGGGNALSLGEIAKSLGSKTNDIDNVILSSCYAGGYCPDEVKKLFPHATNVVSPSLDKPTSGYMLLDLLRRAKTTNDAPGIKMPEIFDEYSPFYSKQPNVTNRVDSYKDWTTEQPWLRPIKPSAIDR